MNTNKAIKFFLLMLLFSLPVAASDMPWLGAPKTYVMIMYKDYQCEDSKSPVIQEFCVNVENAKFEDKWTVSTGFVFNDQKLDAIVYFGLPEIDYQAIKAITIQKHGKPLSNVVSDFEHSKNGMMKNDHSLWKVDENTVLMLIEHFSDKDQGPAFMYISREYSQLLKDKSSVNSISTVTD